MPKMYKIYPPKFIELCGLLPSSTIDVTAVHETEFRKSGKTQFGEGYTTFQKYAVTS